MNLRGGEEYVGDSRVPTAEFGTAKEDAERRDFTVNALFYNLGTKRVEDLTGRGLDDLLEKRKIATPLDPMETMRDDPLRVLRAIRFAVRLDFELDEELRRAVMSEEVREDLMAKVSRERVGKELEGMEAHQKCRRELHPNLIQLLWIL